MKTIRNILLISTLSLTTALSGCSETNISGKVVDPEGNPIHGVSVKLEKSKFQATTDVDGTYSIEYVPGEFQLYYSIKSYQDDSKEFHLTGEGQFPAEDMVLYPRPDIEEIYNTKNISEVDRLDAKDEYRLLKKLNDLEIVMSGESELSVESVFANFSLTENDKRLMRDRPDYYLSVFQKEFSNIENISFGKVSNVYPKKKKIKNRVVIEVSIKEIDAIESNEDQWRFDKDADGNWLLRL